MPYNPLTVHSDPEVFWEQINGLVTYCNLLETALRALGAATMHPIPPITVGGGGGGGGNGGASGTGGNINVPDTTPPNPKAPGVFDDPPIDGPRSGGTSGGGQGQETGGGNVIF
jgi:hypothetical protein